MTDGTEQPIRSAKIDGERYTLVAVGARRELLAQAEAINGQQYRSIEKPGYVVKGTTTTREAFLAARASGDEYASVNQYRYHWDETDHGAPARLKYATPLQRAAWKELQAYREDRNVCLLWQRVTMPPAPAEKMLDKRTGEVSQEQCPNDQKRAK